MKILFCKIWNMQKRVNMWRKNKIKKNKEIGQIRKNIEGFSLFPLDFIYLLYTLQKNTY